MEENDGLPEFICKECIKKLCNAYEFKLLCEKSFKLFIGSTACSTEKIKTEKEDYVDNLIDDNAYDMSIKDEFEDRNLKNEDCSNFDTENICDFNEVSFDETIHKLKSILFNHIINVIFIEPKYLSKQNIYFTGSKKHKKKLKKKRRLKSNNLDVVINDCNDFNVNNVICDDENICDENDFKSIQYNAKQLPFIIS